MTKLLLGCIADDFTGASDLANNLSRAGMRVVLTVGASSMEDAIDADAIVVALKTRTARAADAVSLSVEACRILKDRGARTIYFKICSTFDSTSEGNIGPVVEALMEQLGVGFSLVVPAFPETGRTVQGGRLFVNGVLLAESSMRTHPLTPMTESDLPRLLGAQLRRFPSGVALIEEACVSRSAEAIRARIRELQEKELREKDCRVAIADSMTMDDLGRLAEALQDTVFVTASSGLGLYLPSHWGFLPSGKGSSLPRVKGHSLILCGSCSEATRAQVQHLLLSGAPGFQLKVCELVADRAGTIRRAAEWVQQHWQVVEPAKAPILYSYPAAAVHDREAGNGRKAGNGTDAGSIIEQAFATLAVELVPRGVGRLIVAGGETSGVCVQALGIHQLLVGPQIDPGVPWCYAAGNAARSAPLQLALKSGNFGAVDFFSKAFSMLQDSPRQDDPNGEAAQ